MVGSFYTYISTTLNYDCVTTGVPAPCVAHETKDEVTAPVKYTAQVLGLMKFLILLILPLQLCNFN